MSAETGERDEQLVGSTVQESDQLEGDSLAKQFVGFLREWALALTITTLIGLGLALAYVLLAPKNYTATGSLAFDDSQSESTSLANLASPGGAIGNPLKLATQLRILESDSLALSVIQTLHLEKESYFAGTPIKKEPTPDQMLGVWHGSLSVVIVPKTEVIEIKFKTTSATLSTKIVNALIDAYVDRSYRVRYEASQSTTKWLTLELEGVRTRTEVAEKALAEYQRQHGLQMNDSQGSTLLTQLDVLSKAEATAQADRIMREARYRAAQSGDAMLLAGLEADPTLTVLRTQEADLKSQYAHLTTEFGPAYPKVRELAAQVRQVEAAVHQEIVSITERLHKEYLIAQNTESALNHEMEAAKAAAYSMNEGAVQFQILQRDAKSNRDLYEDLVTKLQESGVTAGMRSTNISIIDYARVPERASDPRKGPSLAVGVLGGLLAGLLFSFGRQSLRNTISSLEEAERILKRHALGIIPFKKEEGASAEQMRGVRFSAGTQHTGIASGLRTVRTALLLSRPSHPPKSMVVTSAQPGDGKSTMSLGLAVTFAQGGTRVLLVDSDLHRGVLHRELGLTAAPGLSDLLTGNMDPMNAIRQIEGVENLFFLSTGPRPPFPADLFASERMKMLTAQFKDMFDFVIFDCPPLLAVPDGVLLARDVDAVVLVVRDERTDRRSLSRALATLQSSSIHTTGFIYNAALHNDKSYYSYDYTSVDSRGEGSNGKS